MKNLNLIFASILFLFFSCDKEEYEEHFTKLDSFDYFIFGFGYGDCVGLEDKDCLNFYKIEGNKVYPDLDSVDQDKIEFVFSEIPLDDSKFEIAKSLIEEFPTDLLESDKIEYGCPNCGDAGEYYIVLKTGDEKTKWRIGPYDDDQSQAILNYKKKIDEVLEAL